MIFASKEKSISSIFTWFSSEPLESQQDYLCKTNHRQDMVSLAAVQSAGQTFSLVSHSNCEPVVSDVCSIHLMPGCEQWHRVSRF